MSQSLQINNNGKNQNRQENLSTFSLPKQDQSGGLDPKTIVFTIFRYKWLILLFLIAGGTAAWFYADTIEPTYESRGTILVSSPDQQRDNELSRIINQTTGGGDATLANEMQVMQSHSFARQVARSLSEDEDTDISDLPTFWREKEDGSVEKKELDAVANSIRSGLKIQLVNRDSDVLEMSFTSSSPVETATIVNSAMNVYVEESTIQNRKDAESTTDFLEKERARLKENLEEAEQELKNFMDRTGIVAVNNQASSAVNRREQIQAELEEVQLELEATEMAIKNQEEELERIRPGLVNDFSDAVAPRIQSRQELLNEYERERYLILQNYPNVRQREETPTQLKRLDEQIENLKNEISKLSEEIFSEQDEYMGMESAERTRMVTEIQTRLVELRLQKSQYESRIDVLQERKAEAEESFQELPAEMTQLAQLQRDLEMQEQLYLDVSRRYADMSTWKETQYGNGRIIDLATVPGAPISPNKILILMMGIVLSGMLAGFVIVVREFFDNSISSIGTIKSHDIPMLAAIPAFKKISVNNGSGLAKYEVGNGDVPNEMVLFRDRSNIVSESIRRLKNNIIFQNADNVPKTIAITSSEKGEGKTSIASNLALAFAEEGYKTLIIDADFRRPRVHTLFGLSNERGISDLIRGQASASEVIQSSDNKYLKVVTSGSKTDRPDSLVNDKNFGSFLKKTESIFDVIILDTPPFGIISDSTSLLKNADATVMVAKYRKTNKQVYEHTLDELRRINANVCGMVLNGFEPDKDPAGHYSSGYYKSMYEGYKSYV
ncbi:GumC family protein [Rhodohalobacter sp.]|uniref:GumC family protein n=1 Tax=Rhodohalobacter sp. TaxID=1974210 RepID=UPI002ACEABD2|nr:polysaccharide biosynthesis tyrosine autokinase [Rhodohalobacter sp.]MDZ7757197.1 polysaccharide biosynthesis tyrosine autokinase [Rhodohalobacter sp.]